MFGNLFSGIFEQTLKPAFTIIWKTVGFFADFYYIWLPILLWLIFWNLWKKYVVSSALSKEKKVLMQIKLPRELSKSPKAMELFLQNLHSGAGEGNFYDKYWKGGTRPWFSLELVSIGGEIRFYIWSRKKYMKMIETQLYSQFPNVEVVADAEDYTKKIKYDPSQNDIFGLRFALVREDPYPIKTYVDFGLDQDPKEEFKVDPIAATMEYLGSIGRGEQIWIQILIRAHKKYKKENIFKKLLDFISEKFSPAGYKDWQSEGKVIAEKLRLEGAPDDETEIEKRKIRLTKQQEAVIQAIERSITKPGFDTAIRAIYLADIDKFDKSHLGSLRGAFKQYSSDGLNGFKPLSKNYTFSDDTELTDFDYPWQDPTGRRLALRKLQIFNNYIKRARFSTRYNVNDFILNTEELATIYHFPSSVVETPSLPRIESKKSEPPPNIPI
jgi:hypothetical protein